MSLKSDLKILKDKNCPKNIIEHSKAVSKKAMDIASTFRHENGFDVDLELIETGAILHDIGRSTTHTIHHGVAGAEILKNLNFSLAVVNITARHIGAGIPQDEAEILGLPPGEYMPITLEEKIVAHADNLINGTVEVDLDFVIRKWEKKMGKNHPSIKRLKKLDKDVSYQL